MKNELAYSPLTDEVFYMDGKGQKKNLPRGNFIQMLLSWLNNGKLPKVGSQTTKQLKVGGKVHWEITCKRIAE